MELLVAIKEGGPSEAASPGLALQPSQPAGFGAQTHPLRDTQTPLPRAVLLKGGKKGRGSPAVAFSSSTTPVRSPRSAGTHNAVLIGDELIDVFEVQLVLHGGRNGAGQGAGRAPQSSRAPQCQGHRAAAIATNGARREPRGDKKMAAALHGN